MKMTAAAVSMLTGRRKAFSDTYGEAAATNGEAVNQSVWRNAPRYSNYYSFTNPQLLLHYYSGIYYSNIYYSDIYYSDIYYSVIY